MALNNTTTVNFRLQALSLYLCLQPRDKAAMLRVNTIEFFLHENRV